MTLSWAFEVESTPLTLAFLKSLENVHAVVPAVWPFEIANFLCTAERRGRMSPAAQMVFLERLRQLPIQVEHRPATWLAQQFLPMVRKHNLSAYDAAYLELAARECLPLATLDDDLCRAAYECGVALAQAF